MHVTVAGKQVETGEALQTRVRDGLQAIANKYFDHAVEANVTFRRSRAAFACDINLKAGRGLLMRGEGEGADAHRAFDTAAEHVAKRLRRHRRRLSEHARSEAEPMPREAAETAREWRLPVAPPDAENGDVAEHGDGAAIVAEPPAVIARLAVGEAAMRLDLGDAPLLLFRDSASGALSLVYRRADGCIGWIETGATG